MRSKLVMSLVVPAVVLVGALAPAHSGSAAVSTPFTAQGTVVSSGQPVTNVPGATGSFVVGSLTQETANVVPAEDSSGRITVYVQPGSNFYTCDSTGSNCTASTEAQVIVPGETVYLTGQAWGSGSSTQLFLSYAFNPTYTPPTPPAPSPTNPQPALFSPDYTLGDKFGVTGFVVATGAPLVTNTLYSQLWGFTEGNFTDYGCGSQTTCRVKQIAAAHYNSKLLTPTLVIDENADTSTLWLSVDNGCTYARTQNWQAVLATGQTQGIWATGDYGWDGTDWRFLAGNVFAPPPAAPSSCPTTVTSGPLSAGGSMVETNAGAFDPSTNTYHSTQWSGSMGPTGPFNGGNVVMTLDWTFQSWDNDWSFSGNWAVAAQTGGGGLSGTITGTSTTPPPPPNTSQLGTETASVIVTGGSGPYSGYTGTGSWDGYSTFGPGSASVPPVEQTGTFHWEIGTS